MALSTFPCSPTKRALCPSRSHNALFVHDRGSGPQAFTANNNQAPVAFRSIPFPSSLTQFTNHPTLPTPTAVSKAGLLKPTHPVDTQPLPTEKLVCTTSFSASKNMSGNANTGAGQQPCFNTGASMSLNSSAISTTSPSPQSLSQTISLGSAGSISLVLSTPTQAPASSPMSSTANSAGLNVPTISQSPTPPPTPVLKGMIQATPVPSLNLDQASTSSFNTSLVTASPYTANETTTFASGTSLWQSSSSNTSIAQSPSSTVSANPYTINESTVFAAGTPLWQSPSANTSPAPQRIPAQTPAQLSTDTTSSLITSSPYAQNEGLTFAPGTQMWQSTPSLTSSHVPAQSHTTLVVSSPYAQNEGVTFPTGTAFWQSSTTPAAAAAASNPNAPACHVASNAPSSIRPMTAPCPALNIITTSPYAQNEGVTFSSGTGFWTSSDATVASTTDQASDSGTSMITSSPYSQNEGVAFSPGTQMWQSK